MSVKIPFLNTERVQKPDSGFIDMVRNRAFPNAQFASITTFLIGLCTVVFIYSRIAYTPAGYKQFLQHPKEMDPYLLDIAKVKHNKFFFYQTVTAMFLHSSYKHFLLNMVATLILFYELQHCWRWSIPLGLLAGFAAHCFAIVAMDGRLLGFSGVICAILGIYLASLIIHCTYLRNRYQNQYFIILFMCIVFVLIFILGNRKSALIHFLGFLYGLLFGAALYPRMQEASMNDNIDKLIKIFAIGFFAIALILAFIV